jgi:hypothetical protein
MPESFTANDGPVYLGDSVYAEFDGFAVAIMTNNGYDDDPRNRIEMEPEVFANLLGFVENLKKQLEGGAK